MHLKIISNFSMTVDNIKHVHRKKGSGKREKRKYQVGKYVLVEQYRKSFASGGYHTFTPLSVIERCKNDKIPRFYKAKKDDAIMAATNFFGDIINIHPFESVELGLCFDADEVQSISIILCSFLRRGRRHYPKAVKMFERKHFVNKFLGQFRAKFCSPS